MTLLARAAAKISLPCKAIKALFAVTTCFLLAIAVRINSLATPYPPINSTMTSILGSLTKANASSVTSAFPATKARAASKLRSATWVILIWRPLRRKISSALRVSTLNVPPPTVPMPSKPTFKSFNAVFFKLKLRVSFYNSLKILRCDEWLQLSHPH